jgi:signal transduction histidine kinase
MVNQYALVIILSTLIILVLVTGVVIAIFRAHRQRITQQMQLSQARLDYEKELRTVTQEVQEQILNQISQELHDNIGQLLIVAHLQVEQEKARNLQSAGSLSAVTDTIGNVLRQVRLLSHSLNTELVHQRGLVAAIDQEVVRLRELRHIRIHWEHDDTDPPLSKDQSLMAFRIFQELISNTLKHARAGDIYITMTGRDGFSLTVADNGRGFEPQTMLQSPDGAGLKNMVKRAALARLQCRMESAPGEGSRITILQEH